jgi:hypothetical protein
MTQGWTARPSWLRVVRLNSRGQVGSRAPFLDLNPTTTLAAEAARVVETSSQSHVAKAILANFADLLVCDSKLVLVDLIDLVGLVDLAGLAGLVSGGC